MGLDAVEDARRKHPAAVVLQDVRLAWRDDEADLVGAAEHEALDEILADRARPIAVAVATASHRQQLLGECERLHSASLPRRRNDAPHGHSIETLMFERCMMSCSSSPARIAAVWQSSA